MYKIQGVKVFCNFFCKVGIPPAVREIYAALNFAFKKMGENNMLDQRKMLSEECNPIMDLVKYENSIKQIDVERPVKVQLAKDGKIIKLTYDGVEMNGVVDRPLKHQLGGRIWENTNDFLEIDKIWEEKFSTNPFGLEHELASVFRKKDLSIRYSTDNKGENNIYGIVTPHFINVNQLDFRQNFIETIRKNTALKLKSNGITKLKYGQVIELFEIDTPGFQTTYRYGLVYAKNNGYEAYKVSWEREVLICTNGLTEWKGSNYQWKHTKEIDLNNFITDTVNEGVANQRFLEERINASKEKALQQSKMTELMERLSLAQASKKCIENRLDVELSDVGNNEWALSQALTWVGTHDKSVPFTAKPKLIDLGTKILEKSLADILCAKAQVGRNGCYGLMLPLGFLKVRQRLNRNNSFKQAIS